MKRDTELLKIQAYLDYCNTEFGSASSYALGIIIAYYISLMGFYLQKSIDLATYYVLLALPLPVFVVLLWYTYRTHSKKLSRIDKLIEKLNKGERYRQLKTSLKERLGKQNRLSHSK